jgi:PKD repeat protein
VVYDGDDYKTIGSIFEFGSLVDAVPPSDKRTLMRRYLDIFDVSLPGPKIFFHADRPAVCRWGTINFMDDSYDSVVSRQWEFPGGNPSVSADISPSVQYIDAGSYDVKLTVSDGTHTRTVTKKNYVSVNVCAGEEQMAERPLFKVYPNPSEDAFRIDFFTPLKSEAYLVLYDMMGRKIMNQVRRPSDAGNPTFVDVSRLHAGIYFLNVKTAQTNKTVKILVR